MGVFRISFAYIYRVLTYFSCKNNQYSWSYSYFSTGPSVKSAFTVITIPAVLLISNEKFDLVF